MGIKKFINSVKESLGLDDTKKKNKKKSLECLLVKLKDKKEILENTNKKKLDLKEFKGLKEEKAIITLQIKKGEKILKELNSNKKH